MGVDPLAMGVSKHRPRGGHGALLQVTGWEPTGLFS